MRLRTGYLISGIATGILVLLTFIWTLPDGKLRIVFCDVGQGDAAYVRFPDGRDMLIDGGPNNNVIHCLSRHMPFWDRHIDIVMLTHPQKDHMQGLIEVMNRFRVTYLVRSDVTNSTEGFQKLMDAVRRQSVEEKLLVSGNRIDIGATSLSFIWPDSARIAGAKGAASDGVLGAQTPGDLNDYSLVFVLRYGSFDAVFPGDADTQVERNYENSVLSDDSIEVLKVPHHGSKTGMTNAFADRVKPRLAVISVGKNNYGHPTKEVIDMLQSRGSRVLRTDERGDIAVISDGKDWAVEKDEASE